MIDYLSLDFFYAFLLFYANTSFLVAIVAISYFTVDRTRFAFMAISMSFVMIFNQWLKSRFQIPINPELLSPGWAYPSGHTHMNIVFWGMLIMLSRKLWLIPVAITALTASFFGMVHFRFHNWDDIYGGVCFGMASLLVMFLIYKRLHNNLTLFGFLAITAYACLYFLALPEMPSGYYGWLWNGFGIISAVVLAHIAIENNPAIFDIKVKSHGILYAISAIAIGYMLNVAIPNSKLYTYIFLKSFTLVLLTLLATPIIGNTVLSFLKVGKVRKDLSRKKRI